MKDIKNKSQVELEKNLEETRVALRNFRFAMSGTKPKNVKEQRNLRKKAAAILSVLKSK